MTEIIPHRPPFAVYRLGPVAAGHKLEEARVVFHQMGALASRISFCGHLPESKGN